MRRDVADLARLPFSYPEVGAALAGRRPDGYHHLVRRRTVPGDAAELDRVAARILGWRMHRGAGLVVVASAPQAVEGAVAYLGLGPPPLRIWAPVRVVAVVDEPDRRGFAYGTLPGHPEVGEEAFLVTRRADRIEVSVTAFSRPGRRLTRLAGPVGRLAQRAVAGRYLRAAAAL